MVINRRTLISSLAVSGALLAAGQAKAQTPASELIGEAEAYLNGIGTLQANFTQIAPDGSLASGRLELSSYN